MNQFLILSALMLSATLAAPSVAQASEKRYYDRDAHDYHTWNSNEDRAYRAYLKEQKREYRDFHRENRARQQEYFIWRHGHSDNALFKVEIR